jgi:hypothetical protein
LPIPPLFVPLRRPLSAMTGRQEEKPLPLKHKRRASQEFQDVPERPSQAAPLMGTSAPDGMTSVGGGITRCPACRTRHSANGFCAVTTPSALKLPQCVFYARDGGREHAVNLWMAPSRGMSTIHRRRCTIQRCTVKAPAIVFDLTLFPRNRLRLDWSPRSNQGDVTRQEVWGCTLQWMPSVRAICILLLPSRLLSGRSKS